MQPFFIDRQLEQHTAGKIFVLMALRISERLQMPKIHKYLDGQRLKMKQDAGSLIINTSRQAP